MAGEVLQWFRAKPGAAVHIVVETLPNGDRVALCGRRMSGWGETSEYRRTLRRAVWWKWEKSSSLYATCTNCTDKQWRIEWAEEKQTETDPGQG
jgi:hypothetical protein